MILQFSIFIHLSIPGGTSNTGSAIEGAWSGGRRRRLSSPGLWTNAFSESIVSVGFPVHVNRLYPRGHCHNRVNVSVMT